MAEGSYWSRRRRAWDELEACVRTLERRRWRAAPEAAMRAAELYPQVASDLARLRTMGANSATLARVNQLVARTYAQIYRGHRRRRRWGIVRFFARDYPRLARQTWRYHLAALCIGLLFTAMGWATVQQEPLLVVDVLGTVDEEFVGQRTAADIRDRFRQIDRPILAAGVMTNNFLVALFAFALGITFGIGTVYVLAVNGVMLGGFAGAYAASGVGGVLWLTILPHGALELSAIVIAAGAGLVIGHALWCPGERTRGRALREEGRRGILLAAGLLPAFIIAGLIEGYITPDDHLSDAVKVTFGVVVAALFWAWLLFCGRGEPAPDHG